jgi:hypothetical protein
MKQEIEFGHLRYFLAVAETLHFSKAAAQLRMAQPPLSQQIRSLERILGYPLFERTTRGVRLTKVGQYFRERARNTVTKLQDDVEMARRLGKLACQELLRAPEQFDLQTHGADKALDCAPHRGIVIDNEKWTNVRSLNASDIGGQGEFEERPGRTGHDPQVAPMGLDYGMAYREPHSDAFRFRGKEWLENAVCQLGSIPGPES